MLRLSERSVEFSELGGLGIQSVEAGFVGNVVQSGFEIVLQYAREKPSVFL